MRSLDSDRIHDNYLIEKIKRMRSLDTDRIVCRKDVVGAQVFIWPGFFSGPYCSMANHLHEKGIYPWKLIAGAGAARGFLQMRKGIRVASRSALLGGVMMMALIEGADKICRGGALEMQIHDDRDDEGDED